MILLFVSSGLGGIPGDVQISSLGQRRAQGLLSESCTAIWEPKKGGGFEMFLIFL